MASGADYERNENYVHVSGAFRVPRQRFVPTVRVTEAARSVWTNVRCHGTRIFPIRVRISTI